MALLQLDHIKKYYRLHRSWLAGHEIVKAVDDVSFSVERGESFGIVGESGCGKSTLARMIAMIDSPTSGCLLFEGADVASLTMEKRRQLRRNSQIVFQEAYAALNPRFSIGETLLEPIENFSLQYSISPEHRIEQVLNIVGLSSDVITKYPAELSGGERQRVCIARALILQPRFILFDEATSGLDSTLQSQILSLLNELRRNLDITYIFITHNLHILSHVTDRVAVMYLGKFVEIVASDSIDKSQHPYTQELFAAVPASHPQQRRDISMSAVLQTRRELTSSGCNYYPRCRVAEPRCKTQIPEMEQARHDGKIACFRFQQKSAKI